MSDNGEDGEESPRQQLLARHRKEKKLLQTEIQAIKRSVPKGDKKQARQSKVKIAELEHELTRRHEKEMEAFEKENSSTEVREIGGDINSLTIAEVPQEKKSPKLSKAQKKRDKKSLKAKELAARCKEAEEDYANTARYKEEEDIKGILSKMQLAIKPIRSDGDCMYSAVQDQLHDTELTDLNELRSKVSSYMIQHKDDFLPFLTNAEGNQFTDEEFDKYCDDVNNAGVWGGQLELRALANVIHRPIHVIQAHSPAVIVGEEYNKKQVIVTFHRHELGLGAHYNSVTVYKANLHEDQVG